MAGARSLSIGVTGRAGSGKSTLCGMWEARGAHRLDADSIGRALLARGSAVYMQVVKEFGAGILDAQGNVDRPALGRLVFADSRELERLNSLTRPPLLRKLHSGLENFRTHPGSSRILIVDAALLVEWGDRSLWDRLVLVSAPHALQVERLVGQRGFAAPEAEAILRAQLPEAVRRAMADDEVVNDGNLDRLETEAARLWDAWVLLLA